MQTEAEPAASSTGVALSPVKSFLLLLGLLALAGAGLWLLKPDGEPQPTGVPESDNFALTSAEAIEKFTELRDVGLLAVQQGREPDLAHAFAQESPLLGRSLKAMKKLAADQVRDQISYKSASIEIKENSPAKVVVVEARDVFPCFLSKSGEDVTRNNSPVRQRVQWTLIRQTNNWYLFDANLKDERPLEAPPKKCT